MATTNELETSALALAKDRLADCQRVGTNSVEALAAVATAYASVAQAEALGRMADALEKLTGRFG